MKFRYFLKEILKGKTMNRALLSSELKELLEQETWLNGNFLVLELGSEVASHQRVFPKSWRVEKSNYKFLPGIDLILDVEKTFPLKDLSYDGVVFFNLLYAVNNYMSCLLESSRVARRFVIFNIPLISGLAPHPRDFNRFPPDRLIEILERVKVSERVENYYFIPIGGSFSSAVSLIDPYLKFRIIRIPIYLLAILFDKLDKIINRQCPLQYLVLIKKQ